MLGPQEGLDLPHDRSPTSLRNGRVRDQGPVSPCGLPEGQDGDNSSDGCWILVASSSEMFEFKASKEDTGALSLPVSQMADFIRLAVKQKPLFDNPAATLQELRDQKKAKRKEANEYAKQ